MEIKIQDSELEVMRILWREKRPLKTIPTDRHCAITG